MLGEVEVDGGEDRDDDHEQPGHRGGVAHLELDEAALVEVERVEQCGVCGAAGAVGDDEGLGECLEGVDDL